MKMIDVLNNQLLNNSVGKESNQLLNNNTINPKKGKRRVISEQNIGKHLKIENNKLTIDLTTLSGALPVDVHLDNAVYNEDTGNLEITFAGGKAPVFVPLATALGLNTKIQSAEVIDNDGKNMIFKIIDTDNTEFSVSLADVLQRAYDYTENMKDSLLRLFHSEMKALEDLDGEVIGYVFETDLSGRIEN